MALYFCGTDYSTACGAAPMTFMQMLASTLIKSTCDENTDQVRVNVIPQFGYCDGISTYWDCNNNGDVSSEGAERAVVENAFALDECGNLGLKVFLNYGTQ